MCSESNGRVYELLFSEFNNNNETIVALYSIFYIAYIVYYKKEKKKKTFALFDAIGVLLVTEPWFKIFLCFGVRFVFILIEKELNVLKKKYIKFIREESFLVYSTEKK